MSILRWTSLRNLLCLWQHRWWRELLQALLQLVSSFCDYRRGRYCRRERRRFPRKKYGRWAIQWCFYFTLNMKGKTLKRLIFFLLFSAFAILPNSLLFVLLGLVFSLRGFVLGGFGLLREGEARSWDGSGHSDEGFLYHVGAVWINYKKWFFFI